MINRGLTGIHLLLSKMPYNSYIHVSKERYEILSKRYEEFIAKVEDPDAEPVKVFDPLSKKQLEELELIREVSRELAKKKDEDLEKAARQKEEAEAKAAEKAADEKVANDVDATEVKVNGTEETPAES